MRFVPCGGRGRRGIMAIAAVLLVGVSAFGCAPPPGSAAGSTAANVGEIKSLGSIKAADYHSLAFSPADPDMLFFGHHNGVMQSPDGGKTWKAVTDRPNFDAMSLGANPAAPNVLWMAGHNMFYKSLDRGKTWSEVTTNLPGLDIHAFTVSSTDPNTLYAFVVSFGVLKSSDGGTTWQPLPRNNARQPYALATGGTTEALYVGTNQGLEISRDGGQSFSQSIAVGNGPVVALAATPSSNVVYAGTPTGLYRSDDGGQSWNKTSYSGEVVALAVQPTNPQRVVLVDPKGKVFGSS